MGGLSIWHWLIVGAVVLIVFGGKGKISEIMGDVAKGINSFKKGFAEEDQKPGFPHPSDPPMRTIDHQTADPAKLPETCNLS
jgi:sec-independent protein translocase protein TatA